MLGDGVLDSSRGDIVRRRKGGEVLRGLSENGSFDSILIKEELDGAEKEEGAEKDE